MSRKIYGNLEVVGNLQVNDQNTFRTFNGIGADANGNVDYPYYRKEEIDTILGMLPVSRIGTMDYLPLNINGSFSGATSYSNEKRVQPTIIEDDGTFVCIRAGTNGSDYDYYYSYIRNIRTITSLQQSDIVQTNTVYRPSFMTSTQKIEDFYGTNGYELLWYLLTDGANQFYSICLTNGSFNEVGHQRVLIPTSSFPDFRPVYAHVVGATIYMWGYDSTLGQGRALMLYTIPVSSVRAGVSTGLARVTGFNGQSIRGLPYTNSSTALIYTTYANNTDANDTLFVWSGNMYSPEYQDYCITNALAAGNSTGTKIRFTMFPSYRYGSPYQYSDTRTYCISMVYDIASKTFTYDTTTRNPIEVNATVNPNGNSVTYTETNPYMVNSVNWRGFSQSLGNCGTICQTNDGFLVATRSRWSSDASYGVAKGQINSFTTQYDSINMSNRTISSNSQLRAQPTFGSAVGENLMGPRFISNTRIVLACAGTYNGVTNANYDNTVVADIGTATNFTYKSLTQGTLNGYAPQTYREFADNSDYKLSGLITLVDINGNVTSHGSSFWSTQTGNKTSGLNINPNTLNFDGNTVSITETVLSNIKASVLSHASLSDSSSICGVYYIPDSSYSKSFACVMVRYPDNTGKVIFAEVDLTVTTSGNTRTITGGTVYSTNIYDRPNISGVSVNNFNRYPSMYVAKYNGFNYVSVHSCGNFTIPGDSRTYTMIGKIKSGVLVSQLYNESYYLNTYGLVGGVLPGVGFGYYNNTVNDYQTKSVFQLFGTTEAQMDAMIARTGTPLRQVVVISQEVPEGYDVYFTQEVPVFLGGLYYKIPPSTMNLTTVKPNPANSTFYIYVSMDRTSGIASYVISTTLLDESLTRTFIGTIITASTAIDTITTEKVTRFLTYRPSTTKRGSAIPASTGVPSATGTRWH